MRRTSLAAVCGAALTAALVVAAPAAYGQSTGPDTAVCEEAGVRVGLAADVAVAASDALTDAQATIEAALQGNVVAAEQEVERARLALLAGATLDRAGVAALVRAVADADAALEVALSVVVDEATPSGLTTALVDARAALSVAIDARGAACAPGEEVVAPPVDDPDPAAPVDPVAPVDEFDCGDFPLADGRTAQDVLDADRSDPSSLDADRDGIACEPDDIGGGGAVVDLDDDGDEDFSQVGQVPSGGVATGA